MSLSHQHKVNTMYSHARSIEERAPQPEISPVGQLKLKQYDEQRKLAARHQREANQLDADQHERRNHDLMYRNGGALSDHLVSTEKKENEALLERHQQETRTMKERHFHEMEHALKKHGTAP